MPKLISPGNKFFILRKLKEPEFNKITGVKHDYVAPEILENKCPHCYQGSIFVAYGRQDDLWDVYRFPCECTFPKGGLKWFYAADPNRYQDKEVEYRTRELPGYVFIHPSHNQKLPERLPF